MYRENKPRSLAAMFLTNDGLNNLCKASPKKDFCKIILKSVQLARCKSALNPPVVYSTDRSKTMVPVLVLLSVALWFILRGDLFYVLPCVTLFLCFTVLLALRLPRLGKRKLILVLFVRLVDLHLFDFVCFLFLLVSGKGCGL